MNNFRNHEPKVCFITAIYGGYERTCKKFATQTIDTDFICFTDNQSIVQNGWIIDNTPYHILNPSLIDTGNLHNSLSRNTHTFNIAKYYKQAFQNIPRLKKYDVIIWLDGSIEITNKTCAEWVLNNIHTHKIIGWNNTLRTGKLKEEVDASNFDRYTSVFWNNQPQPYQDVFKQYADYLDSGFNDVGVWVTCFVAFDNRNSNVTDFLNMWYLQTLQYTTQDQIGFPYTCQKLNMIAYMLPDKSIHGDGCFVTDFYIKHNHGK